MAGLIRTGHRQAVLTVSVLLAACGGGECVSGPLCGDPAPNPTPTTTVASIQLSSPIDTVMAVGRTVTMAATARDASGSVMTGVTYTWSATPASVLSVSSSGLVTALAEGTGTVQAMADGVTAGFVLRAVPADLAGISATLTDGLVTALVAGLDPATATAVNNALSNCASHLTSGNVLGVEQCLLSALSGSGTGSGNDTARLAVVRLFVAHAQTQLQLGR